MSRGKRETVFVCVNHMIQISELIAAESSGEAITKFKDKHNATPEIFGPFYRKKGAVTSAFVPIADIRRLSFTKDIYSATYKGYPCKVTGISGFTDDKGNEYSDNEACLVVLDVVSPTGVRRPRLGNSAVIPMSEVVIK